MSRRDRQVTFKGETEMPDLRNTVLPPFSTSESCRGRETQVNVKLDMRSTSDVNGSFYLNSAAVHSYFPTKDSI